MLTRNNYWHPKTRSKRTIDSLQNVHLTFNNETYIQVYDVAMSSPLGPVLANIFMVELKTSTLPNLSNKVKLWKRYVDDTYCLAGSEYIDNILLVINSFQKKYKIYIWDWKRQYHSFSRYLDNKKIRKDWNYNV